MWILNMLGKKSIPYCQKTYLISHIAKIDPCVTSKKISIKLKDFMLTLSLLMAEVTYCLIKIFSGFNFVATNLFEGFSCKEFFYCYFDYKHFTHKINQKIITQGTNVIMYWRFIIVSYWFLPMIYQLLPIHCTYCQYFANLK